MKPNRSSFRRFVAFVMALVLLATGDLGLFVPAFAADTTTSDLYTLVAKEYFSGDVAAAGILTSGALNGNKTVQCPTQGAISFEDSTIYAQSVSTGSDGLVWSPVSYACGTVSGTFNGNAAVLPDSFVGGAVSVVYQLVLSEADSQVLQLPATLMAEAKSQKDVLDRLVDEDAPYMGYLEQLTYKNMNLFLFALAWGEVQLGATEALHNAITESFTETVTAIMENCYETGVDETGATVTEMKLLKLLQGYQAAEVGLEYYYTNNEAFQTELDLFRGHLDQLLGAEVRNGVTITETNKIDAANSLIEAAKKQNMIAADVEVNFDDLRTKVAAVCEQLSEPNEVIDLESDTLSGLVVVLEQGGEVSSYDGTATVHTTVGAECCTVTYSANGGSGTMSGLVVKRGDAIVLPSNAFTAPARSRFKCWNVNGQEYAAGKSVTITGNTVISAVWEIVNQNECSHEFDHYFDSQCDICGYERVVDGREKYKINEITLQSTSGNAMTAIRPRKFVANVSVTKGVQQGNALVLLAGYSAQGRCVSVQMVSLTELSYGETTVVSFTIDNTGGTIAQLKAFIVESGTNPSPLGASVSFPAS